MAYFNKFRGTKGWKYMWERTVRFRCMRNKQEVERRVKILDFWQEHGLAATRDAFSVSRPTLFRWKKVLRERQGHLESLDPKSTTPKDKRRRIIPDAVKDTIVRERFFDPHLGKEKLTVLLEEDAVAKLSSSTVGRMLADLKRQGVLPDPRPLSFNGRTGRHHERTRTYKKKLRSTNHTGSLVKADTVVRFVDGTKRYILTALDVESKFAFAYGFTSHGSTSASDFMRTFKTVAPLTLTHVQTDNGSEFAHHFDCVLGREGIVHFHTYPRSPKQNAEIERFNRTISEAFIRYHRSLLAHNLDLFNKKLMDWLLWYNTRRPHWSLGLVSPLRYIVSTLPERKSQMLWTSTSFDLYVPSYPAGTIQAIEFETQQVVNGSLYNFAWQANYAGNNWRTFDYGSSSWVATSIPFAPFAANTWHHISSTFHVDPSTGKGVHDSLVIDGVMYANLGITHAPTTSSGNYFSNGFQLDTNASGAAYKVYVDNMQIQYSDTNSLSR